jgi:hypothetical protein
VNWKTCERKRSCSNFACYQWSKHLCKMKKAVFWDVAPCRYCVNWRFGGTYRFHLQGWRKNTKIRERGTSVSRCLQTNVESSKPSTIRAGREGRENVTTERNNRFQSILVQQLHLAGRSYFVEINKIFRISSKMWMLNYKLRWRRIFMAWQSQYTIR